MPSDHSSKPTQPSARSLALRRVSSREQSALELQRYLEKKGIPTSEAKQTVHDFVEEGLVSDERYSKAMARDQSFKDKGPMHILTVLRKKGVSIDLKRANAILNEVTDQDEVTRIRSILDRRFPRADSDPKERNRAIQALLRRGFSRSGILKVLK